MNRGWLNLAIVLLCSGLPLGSVEANDADAAEIVGEVKIGEGHLPEGARVRATPVLGGAPATAPIDDEARFVLKDLPPGLYRFEIVLANNSLFAEAGALETRILPGVNTVTLVVQRGRVPPETHGFDDWPLRYRVWTVLGGVVAAAVGCEVAGCFDDDDDEGVASPSSP